MRIGFVLGTPSPHQVDLLNAINECDDVEIVVGYLYACNTSRGWGAPLTRAPHDILKPTIADLMNGRLKKWVINQKTDIWVMGSVYTNIFTHHLVNCIRKIDIPYVFLAEPPRPRGKAWGFLQKKMLCNILSGVSGVLGTGTESARRYRRMVSPSIPVASLPYYVDLSSMKKLSKPQRLKSNGVRFITCSQLIHRKGIDVLIQACAELPQNGWQLYIYGDGPLRSELEKMARSISSKIVFCGHIGYEQRSRAFQEADVFVFPTRWDGWGMVLPEALAHGLPVITTDQAMSGYDFIENAVNGYIVTAGEVQGLVNAMRNILQDEKTVDHLAANAKPSIENYNPVKGASKLMEFCQLIIKNQIVRAH